MHVAKLMTVTAIVAVMLAVAPSAGSMTALASATQVYNMVDIGTLGGAVTYATASNDKGEIVGVSATKSRCCDGFLYAKGKMKDIGAFVPFDINNAGTVVGYYVDALGVDHGVELAAGAKSAVELPTLGGPQEYAWGINDKGDVSGASQALTVAPDGSCGPTWGKWACHGFIYHPNGSKAIEALPTLSGGIGGADAPITNSGVAGGWSDTTAKAPLEGGHVQWPVLYQNGKVIKLPMPGYVGDVAHLSGNGTAVGWVDTKTYDPSSNGCSGATSKSPSNVAALWNGNKLTLLRPVPSSYAFDDANANAVNNTGVVVGNSGYYCQPGVATIWTKSKPTDLDILVPQNNTGVSLEYGVDINNSGDIVAQGLFNTTTHSYWLTPCSKQTCKGFAPVKFHPESTRQQSQDARFFSAEMRGLYFAHLHLGGQRS